MRIRLTSVPVDDQREALRFYTEVLGFVKKTDVPLGEHSWLTVVSPDDPDGTELVLEPDFGARGGRIGKDRFGRVRHRLAGGGSVFYYGRETRGDGTRDP